MVDQIRGQVSKGIPLGKSVAINASIRALPSFMDGLLVSAGERVHCQMLSGCSVGLLTRDSHWLYLTEKTNSLLMLPQLLIQMTRVCHLASRQVSRVSSESHRLHHGLCCLVKYDLLPGFDRLLHHHGERRDSHARQTR